MKKAKLVIVMTYEPLAKPRETMLRQCVEAGKIHVE